MNDLLLQLLNIYIDKEDPPDVLSIEYPDEMLVIRFAWLIANGIKDIENRNWKRNYRGRLLIHASKSWDQEGYEYVKFHTMDSESRLASEKNEYDFGAIIGVVTMVDCVDHHPSKWFFGPWGFVFESPEVWADPIPYRGQLGLFDVPSKILRDIPIS